jgi:hypothetical protein
MLPMLLLRTGPADDWPHWRGSQRNDIVAESSGWGLGGWTKKNVQWTTQVGEGATSPIVVGPHVYVMGWKGNEDTVTCLNDASGVPQWRQSYRCRRYGRNAMGDQGLYSGPTSSPEFDTETGFLFTLSCDGDLHCWDTKKQGEKVWHINLYDKYEMPQRPKVGRSGRRDYGYTTAPLIYGKQLIVEGGGNAGAIVAFDKHTGRQRWASQAKSFAGHTGGLALINVQRVPCVAALTFNGLLVVRLDAGREGQTVATHPWITSFGNNIASPAVHDNFVLITSGYTQNAMCKLQVSLSGARVVWKQENLVSKTCTPVVHNGRIYWAWNRLHCVDFATGKPIWNGPRVGDAGSCIVTNDDKLIVWANEGDLFLAETASKSRPDYQELARLRGLGQGDVWPHIVLAGGKLYCKDRRGRINCLAIDGRAANASAAER